MAHPTLPAKLQEKVDLVAFAYEPALRVGKYSDEAFEAYKNLYELLISKQPSDKRFHKGYPLHNMGFNLYLQGKTSEALHYFTLAYIEDLLSEDLGNEDKADNTPAGRTLIQAYSIKPNLLAKLKQVVKQNKQRDLLMKDPAEILKHLSDFEDKERGWIEVASISIEVPVTKKQPGKYKNVWENRVFIGGSYKEIAIMNEIKQSVARRGYEPIIASEFDIPIESTHHHSLMLLHDCKYAIFDLSQEAGQLMEIERIRDYEIHTMCVYQSLNEEPRITEMLKALLHSIDIPLNSYKDFSELQRYINSFLPNITSTQ
jgi:hypothetical protein